MFSDTFFILFYFTVRFEQSLSGIVSVLEIHLGCTWAGQAHWCLGDVEQAEHNLGVFNEWLWDLHWLTLHPELKKKPLKLSKLRKMLTRASRKMRQRKVPNNNIGVGIFIFGHVTRFLFLLIWNFFESDYYSKNYLK